MDSYIINKTIRNLLGITCAELGNRVGVTKQTISNYECGKSTMIPVVRVIEIELDIAIKNCKNPEIKKLCNELKNKIKK